MQSRSCGWPSEGRETPLPEVLTGIKTSRLPSLQVLQRQWFLIPQSPLQRRQPFLSTYTWLDKGCQRPLLKMGNGFNITVVLIRIKRHRSNLNENNCVHPWVHSPAAIILRQSRQTPDPSLILQCPFFRFHRATICQCLLGKQPVGSWINKWVEWFHYFLVVHFQLPLYHLNTLEFSFTIWIIGLFY